ncbi:MAG: alpha/beta hydrolase [Chloroflexota bacterium]
MSLAYSQNIVNQAGNLGTTVPMINEGQGAKLVFLHGAPAHKGEWIHVIDLLKQDYHCLAPELLGFGWSPEPPDWYDFSIDAQVKFLDGWLNQNVGSEPFILVTHDIGAIAGMAWASRHPNRVRGIMVMNTVLHSGFEWHSIARIWGSPILGRLFMLILNRIAYRISFSRDFPQVTHEQIEIMYDGLTPIARRSLLKHYQKMTQSDYFSKWESAFKEVVEKVPTTVLWGAQDPLISRDDAKRIGGDLIYLEDSGHWVPLEKPERVAEEIRKMDKIV